MGLEPTRLSALPPQDSVSTIPPPRHDFYYKYKMTVKTQPWYWKVLDVPPLPLELEAQVMDLYNDPNKKHFNTHENDEYHNAIRPDLIHRPKLDQARTKLNGRVLTTVRSHRYHLPEQVHNWVVGQFGDQYTDLSLSVTDNGPDKTILIPHTDCTREFLIVYTLIQGGDNVEIKFWKEDHEDLHREMRTFPDNYDRLTQLKSVKWPDRTWVMFNTNIVHSVENILSQRVQVHMGLWANHIPDVPALHTELIDSGA
jgi:hypothetical protein